jgi:hypothetical protein
MNSGTTNGGPTDGGSVDDGSVDDGSVDDGSVYDECDWRCFGCWFPGKRRQPTKDEYCIVVYLSCAMW